MNVSVHVNVNAIVREHYFAREMKACAATVANRQPGQRKRFHMTTPRDLVWPAPWAFAYGLGGLFVPIGLSVPASARGPEK